MLDTTRTVTTPDGLTFHLRPAGPIIRLLAFALDTACISFVIYIINIISIILLLSNMTGTWLYSLLAFIFFWFSMALQEIFLKGQSIGKLAFGLQVVMSDGSIVTSSASILRNLLRIFDILFAFGLLLALGNNGFRRAGDLVANTIVIYKRNPQAVPRVPQIPPHVAPRAPEHILGADAAEPLQDLIRRSPSLPPKIKEELFRSAIETYLYQVDPYKPLELQVQEIAAWYSRRSRITGEDST
jgi:uncharacterized RDD family membrane protein YckC